MEKDQLLQIFKFVEKELKYLYREFSNKVIKRLNLSKLSIENLIVILEKKILPHINNLYPEQDTMFDDIIKEIIKKQKIFS